MLGPRVDINEGMSWDEVSAQIGGLLGVDPKRIQAPGPTATLFKTQNVTASQFASITRFGFVEVKVAPDEGKFCPECAKLLPGFAERCPYCKDEVDVSREPLVDLRTAHALEGWVKTCPACDFDNAPTAPICRVCGNDLETIAPRPHAAAKAARLRDPRAVGSMGGKKRRNTKQSRSRSRKSRSQSRSKKQKSRPRKPKSRSKSKPRSKLSRSKSKSRSRTRTTRRRQQVIIDSSDSSDDDAAGLFTLDSDSDSDFEYNMPKPAAVNVSAATTPSVVTGTTPSAVAKTTPSFQRALSTASGAGSGFGSGVGVGAASSLANGRKLSLFGLDATSNSIGVGYQKGGLAKRRR